MPKFIHKGTKLVYTLYFSRFFL